MEKKQQDSKVNENDNKQDENQVSNEKSDPNKLSEESITLDSLIQKVNNPSDKKVHSNGIEESEKNRPEAQAASPSIFDKTFEADSKPKK